LILKYLLFRRKKVGTLAAEHWKGTLPKFNTPERKAELLSFAKQIASECAMPDIAFTEEGIAKHIQTFFNEQRRYKIKKSRVMPSVMSMSGCVNHL